MKTKKVETVEVAARVTLIAHAATEAQRRSAFPVDEPVLEQEIAKIQKIAALHWNPPRAQDVLSAPELRTQQTAQALGLSASNSVELRDCDYGAWRGRKMDEVQTDEPNGILKWLTDPASAPHGGESIENLINRIGRWIEGRSDRGHTIAVTHPAVIRGAIVYALRIPAKTFWRFDVAPLSLTDLRFSRNIWTLRSSNCPLEADGRDQDSDANS